MNEKRLEIPGPVPFQLQDYRSPVRLLQGGLPQFDAHHMVGLTQKGAPVRYGPCRAACFQPHDPKMPSDHAMSLIASDKNTPPQRGLTAHEGRLSGYDMAKIALRAQDVVTRFVFLIRFHWAHTQRLQ